MQGPSPQGSGRDQCVSRAAMRFLGQPLSKAQASMSLRDNLVVEPEDVTLRRVLQVGQSSRPQCRTIVRGAGITGAGPNGWRCIRRGLPELLLEEGNCLVCSSLVCGEALEGQPASRSPWRSRPLLTSLAMTMAASLSLSEKGVFSEKGVSSTSTSAKEGSTA